MSKSIDSLLWQEGFLKLGNAFFTTLKPTPLPDYFWGAASQDVAKNIGLSAGWELDQHNLEVLTGNASLENQQAYSTIYSGHQFGVWAGQLGDGRAIHLGTVQNGEESFEIQLKGAGKTPYSRMGDGRAVLRSSIREFLCSEAMAGLGIPTTRALALTHSSAPIVREEVETAAVVTRVAPSFIRFGHFEHFASNQQYEELAQLADFVIKNHYPDLIDSEEPYLALLEKVIEKNAALVAQWQAVGFCHGVLNTDNMSILGLTLDYGPFSFIDATDLKYICNHSDSAGRYSYLNQPNVFHWNLVRLAEALLPLIAPGQDETLIDAKVEQLKELLFQFPQKYEHFYQEEMRLKLGLMQAENALVEELVLLLDRNKVDYTFFFRSLCDVVDAPSIATISVIKDLFLDHQGIDLWLQKYLAMIPSDNAQDIAAQMKRHNPKYILRQYLAQKAIENAENGDFSLVHQLHECLQNPFDEQAQFSEFAKLPPDWASQISVSCSS
jgi:serine/tyrosine/threonine adenylyltransferase